MLSEKYQHMYEGMVSEFERAAVENRHLTASQAAKVLGFNAQHVANMVRKIRVLKLDKMVKRYESAAATARGVKLRGQPSRALQVVPPVKAPSPTRRIAYKTPVELYDAVQVKLLEMNGVSEEFVCRLMAIDFQEYLRAKSEVTGTPTMAVVPAMAEAVRISRVPATAIEQDVEHFRALVGFLEPIGQDARKRIVCAAAAIYGIKVG
jgi:hypothetical protein